MKQRLLLAAIAAGVGAALVFMIQRKRGRQPVPFHGKRARKRVKGFSKELYTNGAVL